MVNLAKEPSMYGEVVYAFSSMSTSNENNNINPGGNSGNCLVVCIIAQFTVVLGF